MDRSPVVDQVNNDQNAESVVERRNGGAAHPAARSSSYSIRCLPCESRRARGSRQLAGLATSGRPALPVRRSDLRRSPARSVLSPPMCGVPTPERFATADGRIRAAPRPARVNGARRGSMMVAERASP
jgi:hypothetical protein